MMKNDEQRPDSVRFNSDGIPHELFHWFLKVLNLMKPARCSVCCLSIDHVLESRPWLTQLSCHATSRRSRCFRMLWKYWSGYSILIKGCRSGILSREWIGLFWRW